MLALVADRVVVGGLPARDNMMSSTTFRAPTVLTGTVIAGEALALAVGMHFLSPGGNRWIFLKTDVFLVLDAVVGLGSVLVAAVSRRMVLPGIVVGLRISARS